MDHKQLFSRFRKRLMAEGLVKSALAALAAGALAVFAASLIYHISIRKAPLWILAVIFGAVFIIIFLLLFFRKYYPKDKLVASRIDAMGLKERVSTMLEYEDSDSDIARLQRSDALKALEKTDHKQLKYRLTAFSWIMCLISICLAAVMLALPYNIFAVTDEETLLKEEEQAMIRDLIEELRQEVDDAPISEELKEELDEIIDNLEESLNDSSSELEKAARISQTREEIREAMQEAMDEAAGEASEDSEAAESEAEAIESEMQTLDEMLAEAMDEMLGNEPAEGEAPEGEAPEGEPPDGEPPEGEMPDGEMPDGEEPPTDEELQQGSQGQGEEQEDTRTEKFYDPMSGSVEYGKVYSAYYYSYIQQLEQGDMPEDVKNINDRYYEILNEQ